MNRVPECQQLGCKQARDVGMPEHGCFWICQAALSPPSFSEAARARIDERVREFIEFAGLARSPKPRMAVPEHWILVSHPYVSGPDGCEQEVFETDAFISDDSTVKVALICGRRVNHAVHRSGRGVEGQRPTKVILDEVRNGEDG